MTWNWPDCVNVPLTTFIASIFLMSAFFGSFRTKRIRVIQCETAPIFSLPPTYSRSSLESSVYLPIFSSYFTPSEPLLTVKNAPSSLLIVSRCFFTFCLYDRSARASYPVRLPAERRGSGAAVDTPVSMKEIVLPYS